MARGGSRGEYFGGNASPEIEAPKAPSGERQRRENRGANSAEYGGEAVSLSPSD